MMRNILIIITITLLLILSGCSKKPENEASIETIDGIQYVHNTGTPLHPNKAVTLEEDLSIGGQEYDMLFRPQKFTVDQKERIYIADYLDQSIKVFDPNGKYIKSIGKKGEGPGEFILIGDLTILPDGRLFVMDRNTRRISLFDTKGNYIESYHWTERQGGLIYAADSSCLFTVYKFGEENPMEGRRLFVKEYDFQGHEIHSFGEFKIEKSKTHTIKTGKSITSMAVYPPHSPRSIFAGDPLRQHLFHCVNDKYMLEIYNQEGKVTRRFDRPYTPLPFTKKDAKEFYDYYDSRPLEGIKKMIRGLSMPSVKTITSRMFVDDSGNLWVETHEEKEEENQIFTAYDIFNQKGFYEAKVWLNIKPEIIVKGKMYLMYNDEEIGYKLLKRYQIIWNDL